VAWGRFQIQIDKSHFEQKAQSFHQLLTDLNFNVGTLVNQSVLLKKIPRPAARNDTWPDYARRVAIEKQASPVAANGSVP
jgi:hypothetical protein